MTASPVQKGASPLKKVGDLRVKAVFGKGAKVPRDLFYEAFLSLRYFISSLFSLLLYLPSHLLIPTFLQWRKKAGKSSRKQDFLANKACLASNSAPSSPSYPFSLYQLWWLTCAGKDIHQHALIIPSLLLSHTVRHTKVWVFRAQNMTPVLSIIVPTIYIYGRCYTCPSQMQTTVPDAQKINFRTRTETNVSPRSSPSCHIRRIWGSSLSPLPSS